MFCSKCGEQLMNTANFCSHCGNKALSEIKPSRFQWVSATITRIRNIVSYVVKEFPAFGKRFICWSEITLTKIMKLSGIGIIVGVLFGGFKAIKYMMTSTFPQTEPPQIYPVVNLEQAAINADLSSKYAFFIRTRKSLFLHGFISGLLIAIVITLIVYYIKLFLQNKQSNCLKVRTLLETIRKEA